MTYNLERVNPDFSHARLGWQANLYEFMKSRVRPLPESKTRNIMFQTMQARSREPVVSGVLENFPARVKGLHFVHKTGYFHRDMSLGKYMHEATALQCQHRGSAAQPRKPENVLISGDTASQLFVGLLLMFTAR